jgi:hypothetical protein
MARRVVGGSPRVIRTDEEAFATWLRGRGDNEYGTPQWTNASERTKRNLLTDFKSEFLLANYNGVLHTNSASSPDRSSKWFSYGLGYSDHRCLVIELDVSAMPAPPLSSSTSAAHNESQSFIHGDGEDTVYTDESAPLFDEAFIAELEEEAHEEEKKRYPARCLAETQSGTQCKNPAKPFSRLCGVQAHAKLAKPADGGGSGGEFPDAVWKFE